MRGSPASRWSALRHHRELRPQNTKTFLGKGKPKPSQPEALSSLPLLGPEIVTHKSIFKERRPAYPIPIPQAHSWMRKCSKHRQKASMLERATRRGGDAAILIRWLMADSSYCFFNV